MVGVRGAAQPRSVASALARARVVAAVVLAGGNQLLESINEGPKALNKGGDVDKLDRAVGSHDRSRLELGNGSDALRDEGLKVGPQPLLALAEHTAERVGKLDPRKLKRQARAAALRALMDGAPLPRLPRYSFGEGAARAKSSGARRAPGAKNG